MSSEQTATTTTEPRSLADQYGQMDECQCPVHANGDPNTVPFGVGFSNRLEVRELDKAEADEIYREHHSYMGETHDACLAHHGVYLDDELVVAMTYRYPLMSRFKVYTGPDGAIYRDDSRATREDATKHIIKGDQIIEINRICVAVPMRNLASGAMSASEHYFLENTGTEFQPDFLLTFIREDHTGSMLKALQGDDPDTGMHSWQTAGISSPRTSGNREETEINTWDKQRWLRETPYCSLR